VADKQPRTGMNEITKFIITSLLSAIIFAPAGYYISDYLSKDNISIEQVDFIPETNNFSLSQEDYRALTRSTSIGKYDRINMHLKDLLFRAAYKTKVSDNAENFQLRQGISRKELDVFIELIEDYVKWKMNHDNLRNGYIKRLEEYKDGDNIVDIVAYANEHDVWDIFEAKNYNTIPILLKRYKDLKSAHSNDDTIITKILNDMKNFKQKRTGWMKINVAFLNFGNTDGLVSRHGFLYINDEAKVKIKIVDNTLIPKVEKRSMFQTDFEIIRDESIPKDIELLNKILIDGSQSKASIEVYDIRGKTIRSRNFSLPIK
jgi:hypothetical protein